jgi:hypothetical protein
MCGDKKMPACWGARGRKYGHQIKGGLPAASIPTMNKNSERGINMRCHHSTNLLKKSEKHWSLEFFVDRTVSTRARQQLNSRYP